MSAMPAYTYHEPSRQPQRAPRPSVHAIPGGRVHEQGVSPQIIALVKVGAVLLVALAVVCCVRLALTSATVSTSLESQQISQQISQIRHDSNALEVSQSTLSNPTHVKAAAAELGMVAPRRLRRSTSASTWSPPTRRATSPDAQPAAGKRFGGIDS